MKTVSGNVNRHVSDKVSNKKGARKFLQTLQPSGGDKENLVGTGRFLDGSDGKLLKPQSKTEVEGNSKGNESALAKVNPSLYKKLIIDDLTTTTGPSEKYWEVIAERRRKALEDVLEQNHKLHAMVIALEEENVSCKKLLEKTTDLVITLQEIINDENNKSTENKDDGDSESAESNDDEDSESAESNDDEDSESTDDENSPVVSEESNSNNDD